MGDLNQWYCDQAGCRSSAVGVGGALGLRAVGWFFALGPIIRCPNHRPDPSNLKHEACETEGPCGYCRAEQEADAFQADIANVTGIDDRGHHQRRSDRWAERAKNTQNT